MQSDTSNLLARPFGWDEHIHLWQPRLENAEDTPFEVILTAEISCRHADRNLQTQLLHLAISNFEAFDNKGLAFAVRPSDKRSACWMVLSPDSRNVVRGPSLRSSTRVADHARRNSVHCTGD